MKWVIQCILEEKERQIEINRLKSQNGVRASDHADSLTWCQNIKSKQQEIP